MVRLWQMANMCNWLTVGKYVKMDSIFEFPMKKPAIWYATCHSLKKLANMCNRRQIFGESHTANFWWVTRGKSIFGESHTANFWWVTHGKFLVVIFYPIFYSSAWSLEFSIFCDSDYTRLPLIRLHARCQIMQRKVLLNPL